MDGEAGLLDQRLAGYFDDPSLAIVDPTRAPAPAITQARQFAGPQIDGGLVVRKAAGSGKSNVYLVAPKYQIVANGSYEGPWGLNFGANLVTRQGYAEPFFQSNVTTGDPLGRKTVLLVSQVDAFRLPAVSSARRARRRSASASARPSSHSTSTFSTS